MDRLVMQRKPVRSDFTKTYNSLLENLSNSEIDIDSVNTDFGTLERLSEQLNKLDELVMEKALDTEDEQQVDLEYSSAALYKYNFDKARVKVNSLLNKLSLCQMANENGSIATVGNHSSLGSPNSKRKLRLPKIELRKFSGEIKDWLSFWSQFRRIHDDKELQPEDKYQYLIQATIPGSRARDIVDSYPPTAENYDNVIKSLKARFGREELLTEFYVRELLSLVVKNMSEGNNKTKVNTTVLYDKLESHLHALESIGMTQDKYAAMLFPLVESCVPESLLRVWLRSSNITQAVTDKDTCSYTTKLQQLMSFLKVEVEGEERINMAKSGFKSLDAKPNNHKDRPKYIGSEETVPTANNLVATNEGNVYKKPQNSRCLFCDKSNHDSKECFNAQRMSHAQKLDAVKRKNSCYMCLKQGHIAKACKSSLKCLVCFKKHCTIMCPNLNQEKNASHETKDKLENSKSSISNTKEKESTSLNIGLHTNHSNEVLLQTVMVKLSKGNQYKVVRALIDSGSQRSYILKSTAQELSLEPEGEEVLIHSLFGGAKSNKNVHQRFVVSVASTDDNFKVSIKVLDQPTICGSLPRLKYEASELIREINEKNITPTDIGDGQPKIEVLIGSDVLGSIMTERYEKLQCGGLVAMKTLLGWVIFGSRPTLNQSSEQSSSMGVAVTSLFTQSRNISDLWTLDTLGICDPYEVKSKEEAGFLALKTFKSNVETNEEGRFEIKLPWIEDQETLKNNLTVAEKRLQSTTEKLNKEGLFKDYEKVFEEWEQLGIIREVDKPEKMESGYYLPHHPVIKSQSTTKIRPVFDASSKAKGCFSLNDVLEKGPNLIEEIPSVLIRFRELGIGVISDIEKAFLQISVNETDRNYLKFLWWKNYETKTYKIYQHCRVVF